MIIMGCDPGDPCGVALFFFKGSDIKRDIPRWQDATFLGATTIGKPSSVHRTHAELDIYHRDRLAHALGSDASDREMWHQHPNKTGPWNADYVALEEPLDGAQWYSGQGQGKRRQQRDTAFRLGVHYANLLHAAQQVATLARLVSFPAKTIRSRRGWMEGTTRAHILMAAELTLKATAPAREIDPLRNLKDGQLPEHILMAVGIVNHCVEYFTDYFPRER
jgi:hypothetical protein